MLGKNLISSVLTQIPLFIFGIAVGVFSTRILGEEGKGVVALIQANNQFFVLLLSLGIQTGIVYFISSKKIPEKIVVGMSSALFLWSSGILLLTFFILHTFGWGDLLLPQGYTSFFYFACLFLLFALSFFNSTLSGFFQAHSKFILLNWISIANSVLNIFIFGILFFFLRAGHYSVAERVDYVLLSLLISLFINALILLFFQVKHLKLKLNFHFKLKEHLKPFLFYNFSIYFGMFINFFNYRLDLWIINSYLDNKSLSYYSLAANIIQIILYISVAIGSVLLPNLSSKNHEERINTFVRVSRISFCFFALLCLIAYFLAPYLIPMMYGIDFNATVAPFRWLLMGVLFSSIMQLFAIYILSENSQKYNNYASYTGFLITVLGGFLIIPIYGIIGAAKVSSVSYFFVFIICYFYSLKLSRFRTFNLFFPEINELKFLFKKLN